MSVRSNVGNLNAMKKAIYASWCHVSSSKENNFHIHCPEGANSWCTYQADFANGTSTHIHGKGLKPEIIKHVKAVFDDLSDETLLNRCLHGKHKMQMRRLMAQYGIEFQKLDLSNITNFRWLCMMLLPILMLVTWLRY